MIFSKKKLIELCDLFTDGDWIETKDQSPDGIRLVQTGNIGQGFFKDRGEKARYISEKTFERLNCTEVLPGDILISRLPDPVGRACIVPGVGEKMITAVDCSIIRLNKRLVLPTFFNYFTQSDEYFSEVKDMTTGTTRERISRKKLGLIEIPLPPLPEQKRIVKILDEVFDGVAKAKENTEKNLENSRELFETYLQSFFSKPGSDWEEKDLGEICELISGQHIQSKDYNTQGKGVAYLTGPSDFGTVYPVVSKWTEYPKVKAKKGDILITVKGSGIGKINLLDQDDVAISRQLMAIRVKDAALGYIYNFLQTKHNFFQSLGAGAAIPGISRHDVVDLIIPLPPLSLQKEILIKFDTLSSETKKLEAIYQQKLADLDELRKSVLKKAFSGEL